MTGVQTCALPICKIKSIRFYNSIILIRSLVRSEENIDGGEKNPLSGENPPPYIDPRLPY